MSSTTDPGPVVVGIDLSDNSQQALRWAAEYARRYAVPLVAVMAWDLPTNYGEPVYYRDDDYTEFAAHARSTLETSLAELDVGQAQVEARVIQGHPAAVLLEAAESAGLLVVGSRGRGGFVGMVLGSVSQHCIQRAACPVVVVPQTT